MATLVCPNYNSDEWKRLTEKLGEGSLAPAQQVKSMKMFMENGQEVNAALARLNPASHSIRVKEEKVRALSDRVVFIGTPDENGQPRHEYRDRSGEVLTSVSRKLDEIPALAYRGDDAGMLYSDSGTAIHSVFDQYANGVAITNIREYATKNNIPQSVVDYAASFIDGLKATGTVLSEVNLRDPNLPIAGRADIIHIKNDGTVDIYDVKTAYRTPHKIIGNKKIWNPIEDYDGYKAQRYSTQLEFYSQMIEKAIGHPVSGQFIIPIEVEFKDNTPTSGISSLAPVGTENTSKYGYQRRSRQLVDEALGVKRISPLPGLPTVDDSSDLITRLTGVVQNVNSNLDAQADDMLVPSRGFIRTKGGFKGYWNGKSFVTFKSQTDYASQKQQIISEYLSQQERNFRDIVPSVLNYIETGKDTFLSSKGQPFTELRHILDPYVKLGYTVNSLSEVKGFEDKRNWIIIRKDNKTDLLYIGSEDIKRPFNVSRESKVINRLLGSDKSLFGNIGFSLNDAKYELGSSLRNTIGDAKKLEGAMIAMKLKDIDQVITFDRILIHSLGSNTAIPQHAILAEVLPVVKSLIGHPRASSFVPTTYQSIVAKPELFLPATYQQDFAKSYHDLLGDALDFRDKIVLDTVDTFTKTQANQGDVEGVILQRIQDINDNGDTSASSLDQKRLLAEMLYQVRNVPTHVQPVSKYFERWASMPQNIGNQIIQDVVLEFRNALSRVRAEFWEGYKKDFNKTIKALFSSSGNLIGKLGDYTISNTTRYYDPLMQKQDFKYQIIDKNGAQKEVATSMNNFSLVAEDSDAFNKLTHEQQATIRKFNDTIEKASKQMGVEWVRGRIPLVKATFYNKFYRANNGQEESYTGLLQRAFDSVEENFTNGLDTSKPGSLGTRFANQANTDLSDRRLEMLGISSDGHIQLDKHAEFETNLEVVADTFMMEAIRVNQFNRVNALFSAANSIFEWQKSRLFEDAVGVNLDWLKVWKDAQIHMRDQDSGTVQAKGVNALNKMASMSLVTKPTVAITAYLSQQLSVFSQAVSNSIGKTADFSLGNWNQAFGMTMNPANKEKIDLLMDQYGIFNLSMSELTNGHRRYGNKSIFRLKYLYGMLNTGDWMTRSQIMVAQMLKHGNWDAHSVVDGKLVYDENKDARFNGNGLDAEKGKVLKESTMRELEQQGVSSVDGKLPRAYGTTEANYLKNMSDSIIGGFDRESRALYSFLSFGKFIGLFKTWLPARLNAMFDTKFTSQLNKDLHFEKKPDGSYAAVWTGREMEGMLHTFLYMKWYIQKYRENPYQKLSLHQKNNIRLMAVHASVLASATILALAFEADDEDEDPWRIYAASTLQKSLGDILATYNVFALKDFLYTPIAVVFIDRVLSQLWNVVAGEKEITRDTLTPLINKIPVASTFNQILSVVDGEEPR